MSNQSKQDIILNIRKEVDKLGTEEKSKKFKIYTQEICQLATSSIGVISFEDPDFLRVLDAIEAGLKHLVRHNASIEAGTLIDFYIDILLKFDNKSEIINRSRKIAPIFFDSKETSLNIIAEDMMSQVSDYLEDKDELDALGEILIETGHHLFKRKNFEQSVAFVERGINYFLDTENHEKISAEIKNILEFARQLAVKNNEYSINYIELANRVSKEADIDLKKNPNAQLAYQSYSEHLLKKSKSMGEERKHFSGRVHKKKRNFSKLFQKKENEEEFY